MKAVQSVMRFLFVLACAWLAGGAATSHGQVVDETVRDLMTAHHVPGMALAIVTPDSVTHLAFGYADPDRTRPVTPDTPFRIASVAKTLVAATAVLEVAAGHLDLGTDVSRLLPHPGGHDGPLTLQHLLTHSAGFDERYIGYAARSIDDMRPLDEYLGDRLPYRGWPAGESIQYSNHGMALAALVLERSRGVPFDRLAERSLFEPLGMEQTLFISRNRSLPASPAQPLDCSADGACARIPHLFSHAYPAGLAFSTARDMGRFVSAVLRAHLDGSPLAGLIPERFAPHDDLPGMSLGFFNQHNGGIRFLAHSGSVPGYWSLLMIAPDHGFGFFLVTNGGNPGIGEAMRDHILERFLPGGAGQSSPRPASMMKSVASFAGPWQLMRYAHTTVERFPLQFQNAITLTSKGDTLLVVSGGRVRRYVQTRPSYFENLDRSDALAFSTVRGEPRLHRTTWVFGAGLPVTYERIPWRHEPVFLNEYVSWLLGLPLILLVLWPIGTGIGWWKRRRRAVRDGLSPSAVRSHWRLLPTASVLGALVATGLFAVFGFGFVARSNRLLQSGDLFFGMTAELDRLLWIPEAHASLALLLVVAGGLAWLRSWWGAPKRLLFSLMVMLAVLQVAFLVEWNYLPAAF